MSPRVFRKPPQNHHTLGGFAEVSRSGSAKVWCREQSINIQRGFRREIQRIPRDIQLGQCGHCEYGDKALDELQLPSSNEEKEPESGERFR